MLKETEFPRTYASSSAAYRAIRQFEEKNGKSDLVMEKMMKGVFKVSKNEPKMTFKQFKKETPIMVYEEKQFKYFPDGVKGEGYYELKKGDRRRPNSEFKTLKETFDDYQNS